MSHNQSEVELRKILQPRVLTHIGQEELSPTLDELIAQIKQVLLAMLPDKRQLPEGDLTTIGYQIKHKAQGFNEAISEIQKRLQDG